MSAIYTTNPDSRSDPRRLRSTSCWAVGCMIVSALVVGFLPMSNPVSGQPLTYKYLATEADTPFLRWGKPPTEDAYRRAAQKWQDVRSCLVATEAKKRQPNLVNVDWDRLYSIEDGEVCLFRIFSSIGNLDGIGKWLRLQGFSVEMPRDAKFKKYIDNSIGGKYINAQIELFKDKKPLFPSSIYFRLFSRIFYYSQMITITWQNDNKLMDVRTVFSGT